MCVVVVFCVGVCVGVGARVGVVVGVVVGVSVSVVFGVGVSFVGVGINVDVSFMEEPVFWLPVKNPYV